jgi:hypothetical protein
MIFNDFWNFDFIPWLWFGLYTEWGIFIVDFPEKLKLDNLMIDVDVEFIPQFDAFGGRAGLQQIPIDEIFRMIGTHPETSWQRC